ncbi:acyl-CoA dehydrogenase domain-containing protein, partial [Vibrio parahaemolyticus]|uniref:acyl-CoA dehydrogenase domain-containing protein n=1 Tax=Vibrio parahaemolyticus TaxID=670 RepID=UPI001112A55B
LKRKERLSARLGEILSQLFISSATLKRFEQDGRPAGDLALVHWGLQEILKQAETAVVEFLENFPNKGIGRTLRVLIMPFGRVRKAPRAKLDSKVARILQTPSATRSRIGRGQYLEHTKHNPEGQSV